MLVYYIVFPFSYPAMCGMSFSVDRSSLFPDKGRRTPWDHAREGVVTSSSGTMLLYVRDHASFRCHGSSEADLSFLPPGVYKIARLGEATQRQADNTQDTRHSVGGGPPAGALEASS